MEEKSVRLNNLLQRGVAGRGKQYESHKLYEQYYYVDVEGTGTMFTQSQLSEVKDSFNIPINSKITYSIIEQVLSILTATKPFPKMVTSSDITKEFTDTYTQAFQGVWYESGAKEELKLALRDMLVVGKGYLEVRTNDFYDETTFNVRVEHKDWKKVIIDPECTKSNLADADYVCIVESKRRTRAEREFNIKITDTVQTNYYNTTGVGVAQSDIGVQVSDNLSLPNAGQPQKEEFVFIKRFFEKREVYVYVSDDGFITTKRPLPVTRANEEKKQLKDQIDELTRALQSSRKDGKKLEKSVASPPFGYSDNVEGIQEDSLKHQKNIEAKQQVDSQTEQMAITLKEMMNAYAQMPAKVLLFKMKLENGEVIEVKEVSKIKKKRILRTIMVGDTVVDEKWLNMDIYPLIQFTFNWWNAIKVYGMIHYFADMVKAMDKETALLLRELATLGTGKVIYEESTIMDPEDAERRFPKPGAFLSYRGDPQLFQGGKPEIWTPGQANQTIIFLLNHFKSMIEYVTGIFGVMQGDSSQAPETFSATQSLQNFGMQRVKLYTRNIESSLEQLALVVVSMLQAYAPRDKVLAYIDDDGDQKEVMIMNNSDDIEFKVRVDISSSIPSIRQEAFQKLTNLAQATGDEDVMMLLTQFSFEVMDLPQGKKWAEQLDAFKRLRQQMQQITEQNEQLTSTVKALENNMTQKDVAHKVDIEAERQKGKIKADAASASQEIANARDTALQPQEQDIDIDSFYKDINQPEETEEQNV